MNCLFYKVLLVALGFLFIRPVSGWDTPKPSFIETHLSQAKLLNDRFEVLKYGCDSVTLNGIFLELGVFYGKSISFIAALKPYQLVYGFDSFEGLPEAWDRPDQNWYKGIWAVDGMPSTPPNVRLIKGWFKDTLPQFAQHVGTRVPIAFMHIDCDLYSSTTCAFNELGHLIREGTIIVFDELHGYPNYENHELKAFNEFLEARSFTAEYLAYFGEQVAVRIRQK